jgi:hypothetical protein
VLNIITFLGQRNDVEEIVLGGSGPLTLLEAANRRNLVSKKAGIKKTPEVEREPPPEKSRLKAGLIILPIEDDGKAEVSANNQILSPKNLLDDHSIAVDKGESNFQSCTGFDSTKTGPIPGNSSTASRVSEQLEIVDGRTHNLNQFQVRLQYSNFELAMHKKTFYDLKLGVGGERERSRETT